MGSVNVVADVLLLRPLGFVALALGSTAFAVAAPFIAMTRPQNFKKPLDALVIAPARFVWGDPLGEH